MTTTPKACFDARADGAHVDEPIFLHPDIVPNGGDDRDGVHVKPRWDPQVLSDQSAAGVSVRQQIQLHSAKVSIDVPVTFLEVQKLIARGIVAIIENSVFCAAFTAETDVFKL